MYDNVGIVLQMGTKNTHFLNLVSRKTFLPLKKENSSYAFDLSAVTAFSRVNPGPHFFLRFAPKKGRYGTRLAMPKGMYLSVHISTLLPCIYL